MAQTVKNLPGMQKSQVPSWPEDPGEGICISVFLPGESQDEEPGR